MIGFNFLRQNEVGTAQFENSDIHEFDVKMELSPSPRNFQGFGLWKNAEIQSSSRNQNTNLVISCLKLAAAGAQAAAKSVSENRTDILCGCKV